MADLTIDDCQDDRHVLNRRWSDSKTLSDNMLISASLPSSIEPGSYSTWFAQAPANEYAKCLSPGGQARQAAFSVPLIPGILN